MYRRPISKKISTLQLFLDLAAYSFPAESKYVYLRPGNRSIDTISARPGKKKGDEHGQEKRGFLTRVEYIAFMCYKNSNSHVDDYGNAGQPCGEPDNNERAAKQFSKYTERDRCRGANTKGIRKLQSHFIEVLQLHITMWYE